MSSGQKKNQIEENAQEEGEDPVLLELAQAVVESRRESGRKAAEPFDLYVYKVHSMIHSNQDVFCSRFIKGYHTLLSELSKSK